MLERIMYNRLYKYLTTEKILYPEILYPIPDIL